MTTVVLAEDHNLVREGLKHILSDDKTLKLVGEAQDGLKAVQLVEKFKPDILLLDLMIPRLHGLEVIRQVRKLGDTKVIVVSMHSDEPYVVEAFRNGAMGYVLKDSTASELIDAIRAVKRDTRYLSPSLSKVAISSYIRRLDGIVTDIYNTLTERERVVLQLAAEGNSNAAIARQLYISPRTAESHRANLMKKLSLRSQTELVRFAIRKKIIAP